MLKAYLLCMLLLYEISFYKLLYVDILNWLFVTVNGIIFKNVYKIKSGKMQTYKCWVQYLKLLQR